MNKLPSRNNGFTLIEIIVAIALLGIISISIFPAFSNIFSSIFSSGDKTVSTFSAQKDITEVITNTNEPSSINTQSDVNIKLGTATTVKATMKSSIYKYKQPNNTKQNEVIVDYYIFSPATP